MGAVSEDCPPEELFALFDDSCARTILTHTSESPMSATELNEVCDASQATVYRRIDRLVECGLLEERTEFQDEGRHYGVFVARLERITIEITDGELDVTVDERADVADAFTDIWEGIHR